MRTYVRARVDIILLSPAKGGLSFAAQRWGVKTKKIAFDFSRHTPRKREGAFWQCHLHRERGGGARARETFFGDATHSKKNMAEDLTDEDLEADLEAIEAEVAALQQQGDDSAAVMGMEQLFVLCIEAFGPVSDKTMEACERLTTR